MLLSDCCTAPPAGGMEEYGICGDCKEHCEFYDDEELEEDDENYVPPLGMEWNNQHRRTNNEH